MGYLFTLATYKLVLGDRYLACFGTEVKCSLSISSFLTLYFFTMALKLLFSTVLKRKAVFVDHRLQSHQLCYPILSNLIPVCIGTKFCNILFPPFTDFESSLLIVFRFCMRINVLLALLQSVKGHVTRVFSIQGLSKKK